MDLSGAAEAPSVLQGSDETVPPCVSGPQYVRVSAGPHVQLIQLIQLVVRSGPSRISWHRQRRLRSAQQRRYVQTRLHCLRSRITNGEQVSRVEGVVGTPFHVFGVLAYVNPCGRLPSIVKEISCPVLAVLVASAGALARSSIPQPTRYLGCRGPSLRRADFEKKQTQTRCHIGYLAAMDLRAKDVEVSKPKRDRGKQAANTCIGTAHGCLRCALTVSRVSCAETWSFSLQALISFCGRGPFDGLFQGTRQDALRLSCSSIFR